jgi:hypothetical protein
MCVYILSFVATRDENGDYANFMQVYHTQTPISLMKKNTAEVVLNGGFKQTFLNYVGTGECLLFHRIFCSIMLSR